MTRHKHKYKHKHKTTQVVHVYRLVAQGTIEERMIEKAEKKQFLVSYTRQ